MAEIDTSETERSAEYTIFCFELGRFFHAFTALEHELTCSVYAAITRMTPNLKRRDVLISVLGGQRMSPLKDTIKRLLRATEATAKRRAYVDHVFKQLGEIQFLRDRLAHYFTSMGPTEDTWINMNYTGIREVEKIEDIVFHVSALASAAQDLHDMRMDCGSWFNHYLRKGPTRTPRLPAWQYKPSMLARSRPQSRDSRKSRQRPPRSSRA